MSRIVIPSSGAGGGSTAKGDWTDTTGVIKSFDLLDWADAGGQGAGQAISLISINGDGHLVLNAQESVTAPAVGAVYSTPVGLSDFVAAFRISLRMQQNIDANANAQFKAAAFFAGGSATIDLTLHPYMSGGVWSVTQIGSMGVAAISGNGTSFDNETANGYSTGIPTQDFDVFLKRVTADQKVYAYIGLAQQGGYFRVADSPANANFAANGQLGIRIERDGAFDNFDLVLKAFAPAGVLADLP